MSAKCQKRTSQNDVSRYADDVPVPAFGSRMLCMGCGAIGEAQLAGARTGQLIWRAAFVAPGPLIQINAVRSILWVIKN
jgi:hypothetical protein